jgi:hypothetical protein
MPRPWVTVKLQESSGGYPPHDLYVRRFWSAVLGVSAVTELLRIAKAARQGNRIRRPIYLQSLMEAGLVQVSDGAIIVDDRVPEVPASWIRRLPPSLRYAHDRWPRGGLLAPPKGAPTSEAEGDKLSHDETKGDPEVGSTVDKNHRHDPGEQSSDPGAGQLTDRSSGNLGLDENLGKGSSDDTRRNERRHRGGRPKLSTEKELDDCRADQPADEAGHGYERQAARRHPRH